MFVDVEADWFNHFKLAAPYDSVNITCNISTHFKTNFVIIVSFQETPNGLSTVHVILIQPASL